jgi:dUTP pyrophosphatase
MYIDIFVDDDDEMLKQLYVDTAKKHNQKILDDPYFYDAGFDLFLPKGERCDNYGCGTKFFGKKLEDTRIPVNKVDFKIKCCAKMYYNNNSNSGIYFTPFYTYARSSISKTPLRLANNQGIIDAGYRGNLIGMFDCIISSNKNDAPFDWYMEEYTRILQICAPGLAPIYVNIVDNIHDLGPSTSRGSGGFGSTGK